MAGVAPVNPKFTFTEAPAGSLDVYLAGTTTRTTTWQDSTQLTENENPISLNARGECSIYGDPDLTYKFVLKNAWGETIWTQDNIRAQGPLDALSFLQAGTGATARSAQDKLRDHVSVEDFGGGPTKTAAQNVAALQKAINAHNEIWLRTPGTWSFNAGATLKSNLTIRHAAGVVLDVSAAATGTNLYNGDGSAGTAKALTANAAVGATSLTVAAGDQTIVADGDWVLVYSETVFDTGWSAAKIGEIVQVGTVASGSIGLRTPLAGGPYNTAATASVCKITFIENVKIYGGEVIGPTDSSVGISAVQILYGKGCRVEGMSVSYCNDSGIEFRSSIDCHVVAPQFGDALNASTGYGVNFVSACQDCTVSHLSARRVRHAVTNSAGSGLYGISRRIKYLNSVCWDTINTGDAFDCHGNGEDIEFINCFSYDSAANGFNAECASVTYSNCKAIRPAIAGFRGSLGATTAKSKYRYTACETLDFAVNGFDLRPATILNATATQCVDVLDCNAIAPTATGCGLIVGNGTSGGSTLTTENFHLRGGTFDAGSLSGSVLIQYDVRYFEVSGPVARANAVDASPIQVRGSYGSIVGARPVYTVSGANGNSSSACIRLTDASNITVSGNGGRQPGSSGGYGVRTTGTCTNIRVGKDNDFSDCTNPNVTVCSATIASGVITLPHGGDLLVNVDTEASAATDDLDTINGGVAGQVITLIQTNSVRDPKIKDGTGNLRLAGDFAMTALHDSITLIYNGSVWIERGRADVA